MVERRTYERARERLEIRVTWPGEGTQLGRNRDVSDSGTYIEVHFKRRPLRGTEMALQLNGTVLWRKAPVLRGRVVRADTRGIAFEFF